MAWSDPLNAITAWPSDATYHVARFNENYLSVLVGLLEPLTDVRYWEGEQTDIDGMPDRILELIAAIDTPYECPAGEGMNNIIQACYVLPANTQQGAQATLNVYNQFPFNTLISDTTGLASLETPGGLIVPVGNWLLSLTYNIYYPVSYIATKLTHGGNDIVFSDNIIAQGAPIALTHVVESDGETQIKAWVNPRNQYCYWGYSSTGYDVARTVGTITLIELSE
jgi:hypothetical protein